MNKAPPLVSVIVPTYNRPDFLKKTMESILKQTYDNIELIVISNGRNAANKKAVESFNDPRIRYADQENSGGPASPRNHGMRLAKGQYIAICDDDDLWLPTKLEKQVKALENNPDCGLSYTHVSFFNENEEWSDERGETNFRALRYRNVVTISSIVLRANLVAKIGGFEESALVGDSEDYEFILRYGYHTSFFFVPEPLTRYWAGNNRTTATDKERTHKDNWHHFKDVMGCFSLVIKKTPASFFDFTLPTFYYMKICLKSSAYILCKKLRLV